MEARKKLDIRAGDTVRVQQKIQEKGKTRLQAYEGLVLARKHGNEAGGTFTVRKVIGGVGVERIFPLYSPLIDKIEIVKRSRVRQANLYHIRDKAVREIRREMRRTMNIPDQIDEKIEEKKTEEVEAESKSADKEEKVETPVEEKAKETRSEDKT